MSEQNSVVQTLVSNLSNLNVQLRGMAESLKKLEDNEIESFKNNYEFKYSVIGEIKNLGKEISNVQSVFKDVVTKMDFKHEGVDKALEEIKDAVESIPENQGEFKLSQDCEKCPMIVEKERWIDRLWKGVIILGIALLGVVSGMNISQIFKLFGVGG